MATVRIQIRRGTAAEWTSANPTLAAGEIGLETDTRKIKFGDGSTAWSSISYLNPGDIDELSQDAINAALTMGSGLTKSYNDAANTLTLSLDTGVVATLSGVQTLTNKTIDLASNTVTGTLAQFNTAVSDANLASIAGAETLTNKTISGSNNTLSNIANSSLSNSSITINGSSVSLGGTRTLGTDDVAEGSTNKYFTDERAQDAIGNSVGTGLTYTDATGEIKVTPNTYEAYGSTSTHAALTSTHGVSGALVGTTDTQTLTNKTLTSPTINTPTGITKSDVGLGNVDNTSDANKPISSATQTALDAKAPLASPTFTGTVTLPSGTVTSTMIADGTIVNADINASAAIALSKLATDPLARANHTGTQTASTISDFDTQVRTSKVTDLAAPTGSFSMNSQKITNLADPSAEQDAATKAYVDAATAGLNVHASVKAATTANITLASAVENGDTLDGVTLATGDRILIKNQTTQADNGVYIVAASGAPTRATDYNVAGEVDAGDFIFVEGGTVNGKTGWVQTNVISTLGTDAIAFTQFSGAGTYTAGTGLTLTGTTFSINTATTADLSTAQTLTNKTINLTSNTLSGTTAQFNTALSDGDFATLAGTETLTGKTISGANNTLTVRLANDVSGTLPVANGGTGITSLGTGVATFLGTPSSANLLAAVTDETGTGALVFANSPTLVTPALGTPSSVTLTNATGLPVSGITSSTTQALGLGSIELGHATDTTISRSAAGVIAVEGVDVVTVSGTQTLTNKTLTTPTLTTPRFASAGEIDDANGAELIKFPATVASAVNEITISNAIATGKPTISATGDDTNITLNLVAKGSGTVQAGGVDIVTTSGTQTLTNKTLTSPTISTISNTGTLTLPTSTDTLVGRATTDTLTNKTLTSPVISTISNTGTLTLPTSTDTLVGRATTDTLTNKTLGATTVTGNISMNYASPTISSNNASSASLFASTVTDVVIGSSTIKTTAYPADGTANTGASGAGFMGMPQVSTGTSRTLALTDAGKHIYVTTTGQTLTIPANSSVAFPIGTTISVINGNSVSTSIAITTDTLRLANSASTGTRTLASNGFATLVKVAATEWISGGNGLT